jgi:hypothetical protein
VIGAVACLAAVSGLIVLSQAGAGPLIPADVPLIKMLAPATPMAAETALMPQSLEKLNLSESQQAQAKEVIRKYDAKLDAAWKQFGEKYLQTVRTEVLLLAAVEDNLTDTQREAVRDQRRKVAHPETANDVSSAKQNQATAGISLTPAQEELADKIQAKYAGQIRSLNRDIQAIHNRLVSLEADKLVELEKLLTKEQLAQLRASR